MLKLSKKLKICFGIAASAAVLAAAPFVIYLKIIPNAISNPQVIAFVQKALKDSLELNLEISNPVLKTSLSPKIEFKVDKLALYKKNSNLLEVDKFNSIISFREIFSKNIIVEKLGADYIFADINKLLSLIPAQEQGKQPQKFDWNFDFYDSILYVKKSLFLYKVEPSTYISLNADDISIDNTQKELRFVHFNITSDIKKDGKNLHFNIADKNSVYIKNKAIWADKCQLLVNKSKIFFNANADKKHNFYLEIFTDKIDISDVLTLIESNIIENNLNEPLAYFNNLKGSFNFNIKLDNNNLNGIVNLNNISAKIVPFANLPILLEKGKITMTNDEIALEDFSGYYNFKKENKIEMTGSVKDYLKSIDTNIITRAVVTNDFTKNYLSKIAGIPMELTGGNTKTRLDIKSIDNKIDLLWLFGLKPGQDILIDGASLTPTNYRRMLKADLHFENLLLNIKTIDYYIAPENRDKTKGKIQPVLKLAGNIDCSKEIPEVKNLGFDIPNPLPSEFLNIFTGQKIFSKGKIAGKMEVVNSGKYPFLNGRLTMDEVRIPSQRIFLKHGEMNTDNGLLNLAADGRYRRSAYDFDGILVNELKFPIVVKNINLTVDDVNVEKFIASANNQNSQAITNEKFDLTPSGQAKSDDDDTPTFDIGNFIVEDCVLHILKGSYKDILFNDVKATLSLNKDSILNMYSNKFEIAQGHSSAKINCDLKKHKYNIALGIKEVDADLIASTILGLRKEISGKASGLIELNTDDSMKLNGSIKFLVENGTIQKVGLIEYILKFAALFRNPLTMISPATFSDLVNIPEGNFDKISGVLELENNVIERMKIKSSSPQLSSFIAGKYNLETSDAALRIYTKFSGRNKGFYGALRNISLNSLANRMPMNSKNEAHYYEAELSQLPDIDADEKDCQIFLTKVDGDLEHNNFISSLKKLK